MSGNGVASGHAQHANLDMMAHLMRRAGFGATRAELETYVEKGYENVVDELLHPERGTPIEEDILERYFGGEGAYVGIWIYRMLNNKCPLQEKMALFWHHVFATGLGKNQHILASTDQIDTFRRVGMGKMRDILLALSKDPAMIFWLDNNENRKGEPNENYGRELLELFSLGVGNYTEDDIKNCARAFTGWTFAQPIPLYPHGYHSPEFIFVEEEHDDGEKNFLGHTGHFNGNDIINIIVEQPACAKFIARHLYNFFVADEPQVPSWNVTPPSDPEAIDVLANVFMESDGNMVQILSTLFNSNFFKAARFKKVKSPTELVTGILKLVGTFQQPEPGISRYAGATSLMGQQLLNPPTVEGWHTGKEWIDGGLLTSRVNFAVQEVSDASKPGIQDIIERLSAEYKSSENSLSSETFVEKCLEFAGPMTVADTTRQYLIQFAEETGQLDFEDEAASRENQERVVNLLQLIVASREYQLC